MPKIVSSLEKRIGYSFKNKDLLVTALTHPSYSNKRSYERFEFLGDIVLDFVIGIAIFKKHKRENESFLTNLKSGYVNRKFLQAVGEEISLGRHVLHRVPDPPKLDNVLEALIGAIFLDRGKIPVERFIRKFFLSKKVEPLTDYKNLLATYVRHSFGQNVEYRMVRERGPQHRKIFEMKVRVNGKKNVGNGKATTRKDAELMAARDLYDKLQKKPSLRTPAKKSKKNCRVAKKRSSP